VVSVEDDSFVAADLPGLIEGAHQGQGLGHQFLRHIERTRVIIHVVDMASTEGRDPFEDYLKINEELRQYGFRLLERPQVIAANKMDMPGAEANLEAFKEKLEEHWAVFPISALSKEGLTPLLRYVAELVGTTPEFPLEAGLVPDEEKGPVLYKAEKEVTFKITRDDDGAYVVTGEAIEKLFKMTDFNRDESVQRFARTLRGMGIDEALRDRGIEDGDIVRILDYEFEFMD
jgi:GTPase